MKPTRRLAALAMTVALTAACGSSKSSGEGASPLDGTGGNAGSSGAGSGGTQAGSTGGSGTGAGTGSGGYSTTNGSGGSGQVGSGSSTASGGSAGPGGSGSGGGEATDAGGCMAPDPGPYPAGPYGIDKGDTITNLPLQGYVNRTGDAISNSLPFIPAYSLDDVRKTCAPYLLIHVSDFVCPGCQHAAKQLGIDGKGILDAGGAVMDILSADGLVFPSTKDELNAWITTANEVTSAFIDADSDPMGAVKMATVRETAIIVQIPSMKVVWLLHGDVTGATAPSIVAAAAQMHTLLGK